MAQAMLTSFLDSNSEDKLKCVIKIIRTTDETLHVKVFKNVSHRSIFKKSVSNFFMTKLLG